jgi:large subunit ribosomal protein L29
MVKAGKIRELTLDELEDQIDQLRTEIFNLRVGNTTKELQNSARIRQTRRDLARVLTVLGQKKAAGV